MDCLDALSSVKIAAGLNLEKIENKPWQICSSNGNRFLCIEGFKF